MVRIFLGLSIVALGLLTANLFVGLGAGDLQAAAADFQKELQAFDRVSRLGKPGSSDDAAIQDQQAKLDAARDRYLAVARPMTVHVLLGSAAAMTTVLVNSIAVTYFVGTSRWCKEVVETFHLDPEYAAQSARLKRQSFPWSLLGIFTILGVIALGAAADARGANHANAGAFVAPHYISALAGIVVVAVAFWKQGQKMVANYQLIDEIMAQVQRVRDERKATA